ncbi:hypothetical protein AKO1_010906 [Acrasis kona]|uniref:Uncharacterized protein n=1 Tax=Acrasis kona TaxID=1008807 RepID=A0AAW2YRJ6_9EUKA
MKTLLFVVILLLTTMSLCETLKRCQLIRNTFTYYNIVSYYQCPKLWDESFKRQCVMEPTVSYSVALDKTLLTCE